MKGASVTSRTWLWYQLGLRWKVRCKGSSGAMAKNGWCVAAGFDRLRSSRPAGPLRRPEGPAKARWSVPADQLPPTFPPGPPGSVGCTARQTRRPALPAAQNLEWCRPTSREQTGHEASRPIRDATEPAERRWSAALVLDGPRLLRGTWASWPPTVRP